MACIKGTLSPDILSILNKISEAKRREVIEVTLDMASNMEHASKHAFPCAIQTTNRVHVIKLAMHLKHLRLTYRWEALDQENKAFKEVKTNGLKYKAKRLSNGDTTKQLLARSRYILARRKEQWTESQRKISELLFDSYPEL